MSSAKSAVCETEQAEWKENAAGVDEVVAALSAFDSQNPGGVRSTVEAHKSLLRELLVNKGVLEPWDRRPCSGATVNDLDLLALRDALQRMGVFTPELGVEPYLEKGVQITPFVPSLCVSEPLTGVLRPRNYAVLLFGREPQKFVPGAFSIYSAYPGRDRTGPIARRLEIAGTLLDQARRVQDLLDAEAITLFDKTDLKTPNAEKYPRRALREAMVNVLAHRDYELFDPARFTSYQDRIEFISPGKLPSGMTIEDLRKRRVTPIWRNQSLAWFLSRLQLAQAEGQGIQTIRSTMKTAGCPPPRFDATEVTVTCVLRAHPRSHVAGVSATSDTRQRVRATELSSKAPKKAGQGIRCQGLLVRLGPRSESENIVKSVGRYGYLGLGGVWRQTVQQLSN